jgi:SAM-dependent methyltransferase
MTTVVASRDEPLVAGSMTAPLIAVSDPPLRPLDRFLRSWRIRQVRPYIRPGCSVLDVGCHDGALFSALSDRISRGVGLDPMLESSGARDRFRFIADTFPSDLIGDERFDVITLLAVLEHVEPTELPRWRDACERFLAPEGLVIATVPSPAVDDVLDVLRRFGLVAGMSVDEHHGFDPSGVPSLFSSDSMGLIVRRRFELGMNNLYVFKKTDD